MTTDTLDAKELEQVLEILTKYCRSVTDSEKEAQEMLGKIAGAVQGEEGAKLIHFDDYVFLILVRGKGVVEVHTMGDTASPKTLAAAFKKLAKYLKNIGVSMAYTYAPDKKFARLAKMVDLKVEQYTATVDKKQVYVFVVKL